MAPRSPCLESQSESTVCVGGTQPRGPKDMVRRGPCGGDRDNGVGDRLTVRGEDGAGQRRALAQDQGAKGVLATLWPVADRSTGELMKHFYRLHADQSGMTKAEALRQAQLLFLRGQSIAGTLEDTTRGMRVRQVDTEADIGDKDPFTADGKNPYTHPFYWAPFILMGNWL